MFPDDFFGADYYANDYYPPDDGAGSGSGGSIGSNDYTFRAPWRGRHRVVS